MWNFKWFHLGLCNGKELWCSCVLVVQYTYHPSMKCRGKCYFTLIKIKHSKGSRRQCMIWLPPVSYPRIYKTHTTHTVLVFCRWRQKNRILQWEPFHTWEKFAIFFFFCTYFFPGNIIHSEHATNSIMWSFFIQNPPSQQMLLLNYEVEFLGTIFRWTDGKA